MKVINKGLQISFINNNQNLFISKGSNINLNKCLKMKICTKQDKTELISSLAFRKNSLIFIPKKQIFEKFKERFLKLNQNNLKQIKKEEEYYVPKEEIVFINKKFLLVDASKNFVDAIKFMQKIILYPIMAVCSFFLLRAIFRINYGINQNKKHIIIKLFLLDNGKECEIHTLEKMFVTDIKNIRRLQIEEGLYVARNIQNMKKNYIPLAIDTRLFLIPLVSTIENQEILSAVSNGKYIKADDHINVENSIDIENYDKHKH